MQVDFYHLATTPIDRVLPRLAERVVADGGRLLVVSGDAEQRRRIDGLLWTYSPASFLPHAQAGQGEDSAQPVLIAADASTAGNGARHVLIADGEWRDAALAYDRAFHLFDDVLIDAARTAWKGLAGREGIERRFWKQNAAGKWEQAA
ncbi:DNA polymerase III subunit chi [Sphingomonas sp. CJ99]